MVTTLAGLAQNGPALELGIGTGLVALPLAAAGVEVHGIEASPAMIAKMMDKKGAGAIPVTQGDFADVPVAGQYPLVFVVFNTNVASRLTDGGIFVVSAFVPDMSKFNRGQSVEARRVEEEQVTLEVNHHNSVTQLVSSQSMTISNQGTKFLPVQIRYVWPSELDLMAQLAGMHLRERWGDWEKAPFTSQSRLHVSVYEMA